MISIYRIKKLHLTWQIKKYKITLFHRQRSYGAAKKLK